MRISRRDQSWLPVKIRTEFQILLLTEKTLKGLAPSYLKGHLVPYLPDRALRSQTAGLLVAPGVPKVEWEAEPSVVRLPVCVQ